MGELIRADFGGEATYSLLTKRQLAVRVHRSPRWIEMRIAEGMPSHIDDLGLRLFDPSEVEPWIACYESALLDSLFPPGTALADPPEHLEPDRLAILERRVAELERAAEGAPAGDGHRAV